MAYTQNNPPKVAVVTGAESNLGYSIVKQILTHHPDYVVYLTSADLNKGKDAVQRLKEEAQVTARFHQLDILNSESIRTFKAHLARYHPRGIDIFVNNATIFPAVLNDGGSEFDSPEIRRTLKHNYFATLNVCTEMFPLLSHDARIVMVSSRLAHVAFMNASPNIQDRLKNCLAIEDITKLMSAFLETDPMDYEADGWLTKPPNTEVVRGYRLGDILPFAISKLGLAFLARAYQNIYRSKNYRVLSNACCPGPLVRTDPDNLPLIEGPCDQAADTPFYLTDLERESKHIGDFVAERKSIGHLMISESDLVFFEDVLNL